MRFVTLQYAELQDLGGSGLEPTPGRRMHINADHIISLTETDYRGVTRIRVTNEAHHRDVFGELDAVLAMCADPVFIEYNPPPADAAQLRRSFEATSGHVVAMPGWMTSQPLGGAAAEFLAAQRELIANQQREALTDAAAARRSAQGITISTPSTTLLGLTARQRTEAAPPAATSPRERSVVVD